MFILTVQVKKSYKMHYLFLCFLKQRTVYTSDGSGSTPGCGVVHQIFTGAQVGDRHGARGGIYRHTPAESGGHGLGHRASCS